VESNIPSPLQQLHQVIGHISSSKIVPLKSVSDGESLNDGSNLSDTISDIHNDTSGLTLSIEREDCLVLKVNSRNSERLKEDFSNLSSV